MSTCSKTPRLAQKKVIRANLPVTNATLVTIATKTLLQTNTIPYEPKAWEKRTLDNKKWAQWKTHYLEAHKGCDCHIQACRGADQFGSANAATGKPAGTKIPLVTPTILDHIDGYINNTNNVMTNEVLEQLITICSK